MLFQARAPKCSRKHYHVYKNQVKFPGESYSGVENPVVDDGSVLIFQFHIQDSRRNSMPSMGNSHSRRKRGHYPHHNKKRPSPVTNNNTFYRRRAGYVEGNNPTPLPILRSNTADMDDCSSSNETEDDDDNIPDKTSIPTTVYPETIYKNSIQQCLAEDYREIYTIGSGLQGSVILAQDRVTRKKVAIKIPAEQSNNDDDEYHIESLLSEAETLRTVPNHPNIIKLIKLIKTKNAAMLVLDYAPNGDIFEVIESSGALSEPEAVFYCKQLLQAIQACHEAHIAHRDIKLENLLLDDQMNLRLCDFGLSSSSLSKASNQRGTLGYMAPEIIAKEEHDVEAADIWSAGVTLFIMLAGFPPLKTAAPSDWWYDCLVSGRHRKFWAAHERHITNSISPMAKDLINRMLDTDPVSRLTAEEALSHPFFNTVAMSNSIRFDMKNRRDKYMNL